MREKKRNEGTGDPGRTLDTVVVAEAEAEQEQEEEQDEAAVRETPHLLQTRPPTGLTAECRVHSADRRPQTAERSQTADRLHARC